MFEKTKKMTVLVSGIMATVLSLHLGVVLVQHHKFGAAIPEPATVALLALLLGISNIILAMWCIDHQMREKKIKEIYQELTCK